MVLLICAVLLPIAGGTLLFLLRPSRPLRMIWVMAALLIQTFCIAGLLVSYQGSAWSLAPFIDTLPFLFRIDSVSLYVA